MFHRKLEDKSIHQRLSIVVTCSVPPSAFQAAERRASFKACSTSGRLSLGYAVAMRATNEMHLINASLASTSSLDKIACVSAPSGGLVHMLIRISLTMRRSCNDSAIAPLRQQEEQAMPTLWQCHRRGLLFGAAGLLGLSLHTAAKVWVPDASEPGAACLLCSATVYSTYAYTNSMPDAELRLDRHHGRMCNR